MNTAELAAPRRRNRTAQLRRAMAANGPMDTAALAAECGIARTKVWDLLKVDIARGRIRRVRGPGRVRLALATPPEVRNVMFFFAVEKHGLPDAEALMLLADPAVDGGVPWGGWWTGEHWVGLDGHPCPAPTHWAEWPQGLVAWD